MTKLGRTQLDVTLWTIIAVIGTMATIILTIRDDSGLRDNHGVWLGVETMELTPAVKKQYDIRALNGLLVSRVFIGSPADTAGVRTGDVLRRWNGAGIISQNQLVNLAGRTELNGKVRLTVDRMGKPVLISVQLAPRPGIGAGGAT
ncbi:PDZ domain-containing protein [Candidatus Hydrogenedentota bacterium]